MRRGPQRYDCEQTNEIPYTRTLFRESCRAFRLRIGRKSEPLESMHNNTARESEMMLSRALKEAF